MCNIIVVDFDETLAIYEGNSSAEYIPTAKPNLPLIEKLNKLSRNGFEIHIYTARGHLSAKSRADAKHKYDKVIKEWLEQWDVSYDLLSFEKPLAVCYIDDKAIRPDEIHLLDNLKLTV
jgi:capsule biosynthesis phosphatase